MVMVLYYTVLYFTILYYTVLYCTILYYTVLYCTGEAEGGEGDFMGLPQPGGPGRGGREEEMVGVGEG